MWNIINTKINIISKYIFWLIFLGDYFELDVANETAPGTNFSIDWRSYRGVDVPITCPAGSYCPLGTKDEREHLCPPGSYSNTTGLHRADQCTPCDPGWYCSGEGRLLFHHIKQ